MLLRPWTLADLDSLVLNANNANVASTMMNVFPHPYSEENGKAFIAFASADTPTRMFAIELDGKAVGGIGLHPQQDIACKNMEIGYWIGQGYWGKGIITEAIKQMVEYGFKTYDITRIYGKTFGNNPASSRALEKAGFVLEARFEKTFFKNGEFVDELVYARRVFSL